MYLKKNGKRSYWYYMTTPSLHSTSVSNVNFLDVNPVTTLVCFFSLSLNWIRCFFYRKWTTCARLTLKDSQTGNSDSWSANNSSIEKDIYWVSDRGGSDNKNRPVPSTVIELVTFCNWSRCSTWLSYKRPVGGKGTKLALGDKDPVNC